MLLSSSSSPSSSSLSYHVLGEYHTQDLEKRIAASCNKREKCDVVVSERSVGTVNDVVDDDDDDDDDDCPNLHDRHVGRERAVNIEHLQA